MFPWYLENSFLKFTDTGRQDLFMKQTKSGTKGFKKALYARYYRVDKESICGTHSFQCILRKNESEITIV